MKILRQKQLLLLLVFVFLLASSVLGAQAAGKPKVYRGSKSIALQADITNDGKADAIRIIPRKSTYAYKNFNVQVNKKTVLSETTPYDFFDLEVQYIKMSKNREFLKVACISDDYWHTLHRIYRYDAASASLVCVLNLEDGLNSACEVTGYNSTTIKMRHSYQFPYIGRVTWTFKYKYKNGSFKLLSKNVAVKSDLGKVAYPKDGLHRYFAKNNFKATKKLTFTKSVSTKSTAFSSKKGDVLTLQKIYIDGYNSYMKFKKGSKSGWLKVYGKNFKFNYSRPWFYGVVNRLAG